ncbi:alpha/beta-hydrolase [Aspergillus unguis]
MGLQSMHSIGGIDVAFRPANHNLKPWLSFEHAVQVLPKGWTKAPGRRPLPEDIVFEKDIPVPMRDGTVIRVDVFRPPASEPVPALLAWSPYGKQGNAGVPRDWTSDLEKFEALDPAEWCPRGYAIVNVDPRGVGDSEGDIFTIGTQEGRDGYDTVEHIAALPWCNGSVGFMGNSWLAVSQWFIAAERPPHLKAIAPWEGFSDLYRELICRGGIPNPFFFDYRSQGYCGKYQLEDMCAMIRKDALWNGYWADKRARFRDIEVPMYVLASFSSGIHTEGSLRGLRIHHTQEWHDIYQKSSNDDLQKFFDKYLRGLDNDWENTPRVRHSLLGYTSPSIVNRPDVAYPPPVKHTTLFLSCSDKTLQPDIPQSGSTDYQSESWDEGAGFTYKFNTCTELVGFSRATLYMSCADTDDMDVYVMIRKLDANGRPLLHMNIPLESFPPRTKDSDVPDTNIFKYVGPNGRLRASHRKTAQDPALTPEQSKVLYPADVWHPHDSEDKVSPGTIVRLEIPLWPSGMIFQAGEALRLEIKGRDGILPEFPALDRVPTNLNRGRHVVHCGPEHPSSIIVPLVDSSL